MNLTIGVQIKNGIFNFTFYNSGNRGKADGHTIRRLI